MAIHTPCGYSKSACAVVADNLTVVEPVIIYHGEFIRTSGACLALGNSQFGPHCVGYEQVVPKAKTSWHFHNVFFSIFRFTFFAYSSLVFKFLCIFY